MIFEFGTKRIFDTLTAKLSLVDQILKLGFDTA